MFTNGNHAEHIFRIFNINIAMIKIVNKNQRVGFCTNLTITNNFMIYVYQIMTFDVTSNSSSSS